MLAAVSVALYPIMQNITSIPIYSILMKYDLLDVGFKKPFSNFISVLFPWLVCIPLYTGAGFNDLCNWGGVILSSIVNFVIPPYLYIIALTQVINNRKNTYQQLLINDHKIHSSSDLFQTAFNKRTGVSM